MGTITEIKAQKSNKNRVSIYVDGQFLTGMQSIVALKNGLKTGAVIDEKDILQCVHESECAEAFDKCIALLLRAKTEKMCCVMRKITLWRYSYGKYQDC